MFVIYILQEIVCPLQCLWKGHAIYCTHTDVDINNLHSNMTIMYLPYTTSRINTLDDQLFNFIELGLLNMSNSRIATNVIKNFLHYLPNLRVLLMRNSSVNDLYLKLFTNLRLLTILDLQKNSISLLTSECFTGLVSVTSLDLHDINIKKIEPKTFDGMDSLQLLDLSNNLLDYLDDGIFQSLMMHLRYIDLRGNTFKEIDINTFKKLHVLVHVSTVQLCCYIDASSICLKENSR